MKEKKEKKASNLLAQEQVLTAGAGYPVPAYVAPQGGAGEEGAP